MPPDTAGYRKVYLRSPVVSFDEADAGDSPRSSRFVIPQIGFSSAARISIGASSSVRASRRTKLVVILRVNENADRCQEQIRTWMESAAEYASLSRYIFFVLARLLVDCSSRLATAFNSTHDRDASSPDRAIMPFALIARGLKRATTKSIIAANLCGRD